jgi:hypothetical protein
MARLARVVLRRVAGARLGQAPREGETRTKTNGGGRPRHRAHTSMVSRDIMSRETPGVLDIRSNSPSRCRRRARVGVTTTGSSARLRAGHVFDAGDPVGAVGDVAGLPCAPGVFLVADQNEFTSGVGLEIQSRKGGTLATCPRAALQWSGSRTCPQFPGIPGYWTAPHR